LRFNASGTYLTDYRVAVTPTAPLLDQRNLIFRPLKFKARASVTWDHGPLTARAQAVHVGGYTNNVIVPNQQVASYTPVDLTLSWRVASAASNPFGGELAISFEVRNVLDEDPPYVNIAPSGNGSGGYDATAASPVGRLFAVSVRAKF
jgi:iron complex outermembrane receptor protein